MLRAGLARQKSTGFANGPAADLRPRRTGIVGGGGQPAGQAVGLSGQTSGLAYNWSAIITRTAGG